MRVNAGRHQRGLQDMGEKESFTSAQPKGRKTRKRSEVARDKKLKLAQKGVG